MLDCNGWCAYPLVTAQQVFERRRASHLGISRESHRSLQQHRLVNDPVRAHRPD